MGIQASDLQGKISPPGLFTFTTPREITVPYLSSAPRQDQG